MLDARTRTAGRSDPTLQRRVKPRAARPPLVGCTAFSLAGSAMHPVPVGTLPAQPAGGRNVGRPNDRALMHFPGILALAIS